MNGEVDSFYRRVLSEIITDKTASILVCGGDITDKEVFASLGYLNVVISGMERRVYDYSPFAGERRMLNHFLYLTNQWILP